jgi:hypothetical protein
MSDAHQRLFVPQRAAFAWAMALVMACSANADAASPEPLPSDVGRATVVGRWDRVQLGTREESASRLLVTPDAVWVGTENGLAFYDGDRVTSPPFTKPDQRTALIVNDLIDLGPKGVLVGTINGSLWRADRNGIERLVNLGQQAHFNFLRRSGGKLVVASSFGLRLPHQFNEVKSALASLGVEATLRQEAVERMAEVGGRLFALSGSSLVELFDDERRPAPLVDFKRYAPQLQAIDAATVGVATYGGCVAVPVDAPGSAVQLTDSYCPALMVTPDGELWMATDRGVFRHERSHWTQYFGAEAVEINPVGAFAGDAHGNLWVGGSHGLWLLSSTQS